MRKELRWTKGLPGNMIKQILEMEPELVDCIYSMPKYTEFIIRKKDEWGVGIAICSPIEVIDGWGDSTLFNAKKGKIVAAGRAIAALKTKKSSLPIRKKFPFSWKRSQIKRLKEMIMISEYKSNYLTR